MNRSLSVLCILLSLASYGMQLEEFFSVIDKYGTDDILQEKLTAIRSESKEADFFLRKFYEGDSRQDGFSQSVRDNVKRAADHVGRRYYEEAIKDCTNVELLRKALEFLCEDSGHSMDDTSESNSQGSLISAAKNLLMLRQNYNQAKRAIVGPPVF